MAEMFDGSDPDVERVRRWRRDWRTLSADCERIRRNIDTEIEKSRLRPPRGIESAEFALPRAHDSLTVAERVMDHLRFMTRTLD
ncbi:hypothetical protein AB0D66_33755 [Streptomyces sp. NPDC048270]|uniref:hypothetical protein n=1 Tax=Streptomyces sp. NPDC048270 TaxID=3154615 RepID=UPI0033F605C8